MTKSMRRLAVGAATAGLVLSGAGVGASSPAHAADTMWCPFKVVAADGLNIRKGPGTQYERIKVVNNGTVGLASETIKNGFRQFQGGWASAAYLRRTPALCGR